MTLKLSTAIVLSELKQHAKSIENKLGSEIVTADAILGAIGEEYQSQAIIDVFQNLYLKFHWSASNNSEYNNDYKKTKLLPSERDLLSAINNFMENDIGPGNVNIRTAIDIVNEYTREYPNSDPLNLKKYKGNPSLMVQDMMNSKHSINVALTGFYLKKAEKVAEKSKGWSNLSLDNKKAVLITMFNNGIDKTAERIKKNPNYTPAPGNGESGGQWYLDNKEKLKGIAEGRFSYEQKMEYRSIGTFGLLPMGTKIIEKDNKLRENNTKEEYNFAYENINSNSSLAKNVSKIIYNSFKSSVEVGKKTYQFISNISNSKDIKTINGFFVSPTRPAGVQPNGKPTYDPIHTRSKQGWGIWGNTNSLNFDHGVKGKTDNTYNAFSFNIVTDDYRVANTNFSRSPISIKNEQPKEVTKKTDFTWLTAAINRGRSVLPTDPLVLDLDGNGIRLSGYQQNNILFDIDNDGGSLERTGWLNAWDGFLVNDLNKNGKIDNISEIFSEFYAGKAGKNGESGEKRFRNGFEALKSLDSNKDNVFDHRDAAWNTVRVWRDSNQNGISESSELFTLNALKISSIHLNYRDVGGEYYDGNEILARGNFVINGKSSLAMSVNFLADPRGNTFTNMPNGMKTEVQGDGRIDQTSLFTSTATGNTTLEATKLGVKNIAAGVGNDILRGDDGNNWLAGNAGSDTFYGGAGDDVFIVDGDDDPNNIHGGAGNDIIQVVGNKPIHIDLFKAEVEAIQGGRGNDVIVSSGNTSVYMRGGDGDDTLFGGFANDALSGENGNDRIFGNAGDDILRGHRGDDYLSGDEGNDLLWGGSGDDILLGGKGNDMLSGDAGDDQLDGGEGEDIAEFSGNFADYKITKIAGGLLVSDRVQGRDGTDFLRNIEKANFKDITAYKLPTNMDFGLDNPLPVADVLDRDKNGKLFDGKSTYLISQAQLLKNDIDLQGDKLAVTQLTHIQGGTVAITKNGDIEFKPTPGYAGVAGFKYTIKDSNNRHGLLLGNRESSAQVYLKTPNMPNDPLFYQQYYLSEANVLPVWNKYTGKNIRIGQFEPSGPFSVAEEVADYRNPELRNNIDKNWLYDYEFKTREEDKVFSKHATEVASVMVGARNNEGGVGVAYGSTTASHWVGADTAALWKMKDYDVVNHSWGHTVNFSRQIILEGKKDEDADKWLNERYISALKEGRRGLGTVIVNSAGNERKNGGNANYSYLTSAPHTVVVGAAQLDENGNTIVASYSNSGASILVSAHGSKIVSSSRRLINENGGVLGTEFSQVDGTSFSAPIVSGVVALMLEANRNLGYRDVQEILSLTARGDKAIANDWQWNGDQNWNGGGRHVSHDYGYGIVDAQAAVRLAENWHTQKTYNNEQRLEKFYKSGSINQKLDDNGGRQFGVKVTGLNLSLENIAVQLHLSHSRPGDLSVKLISPSGTESLLMLRPGVSEENKTGDKNFNGKKTLNYTFNSALLRGENPNGEWKLQVFDNQSGETGILHDWSMSFYGTVDNGHDTYVYTDEYQTIKDRNVLYDKDNGFDVINVSAISGKSNIDLTSGKAGLNNKALTINNPNEIEGLIGGDYNDTFVGNGQNNLLVGGRGDDILLGMDGNDILYGGPGNNRVNGGKGADIFVVNKNAGSTETITDFTVGVDRLVLTEFNDLKTLNIHQDNKDTVIDLGNKQLIRLPNVTAKLLTLNNIVVLPEKFSPVFMEKYAAYGFASNTAKTQLPDVEIVYWGTAGNDHILGGSKDDTIYGGAGDDIIMGEPSVPHRGGNDILYGGEGNDVLRGCTGDDILYGGPGVDKLCGDAGNDTIYLEDDDAAVGHENKFYRDGITLNGVKLNHAENMGDAGNDRFVVVRNATKGVGKGLLKNLIGDFDPNNPNEKIDLSQFSVDITLHMVEMTINAQLYSRLWLGTPGENTQYITLKGVRADKLPLIVKNLISPQGAQVSKLQQNFVGTDKNDILKGNAVSNYFDGKLGTDIMEGFGGDDTYVVDNVEDKVIEANESGYDLVKSYISYRLSDHVEELQLLGTANINGTGNRANNRILGNAGNNHLNGGAGDDILIGGKGDDHYFVDSGLDDVIEKPNEGIDTVVSSVSYTLPANVEKLALSGIVPISATGNELNNVLIGNDANNRLIGYEGNDALRGKKGNDFLMGGAGNDTYVFTRGDGQDIIQEEQGKDTLKFDPGINHNQLWFQKSEDDLLISIIGTNDSIRINDWYNKTTGQDQRIESIITGDGKRLTTEAQLHNLISAMASFAPPPPGQINLPEHYQQQLNTLLTTNWK